MKNKFRNIGPVSEAWLNDVGIFSIKDLENMGAEKVFKLIQDKGHNPSKNFLYSLIGAIHDEDWKVIADVMRKEKSKICECYDCAHLGHNNCGCCQ